MLATSGECGKETMKATIVEEAHNRVVWEVKTSLLWIELGLFIGGMCAAALLVVTPSPLRWTLAGILMALVFIVGAFLALTTPLAERGELERTLDGGSVSRTRRWLFFGQRLAWHAPLEAIAGFRPEPRTFEDTDEQTYTLSRLVAIVPDAAPEPLTDWLEPQFVVGLGEALTKAARIGL